ncbi:hypothetical protein VKT23_016144 [Stygiomarasmius scandens]|uniref:Uncharacterized protein n=1 Tax=Marasmiellus scandens TaxID=2682957 RepID=A0ABR1J0E9_9AGAR
MNTPLISIDDEEYRLSLAPIRRPRTPTRRAPYLSRSPSPRTSSHPTSSPPRTSSQSTSAPSHLVPVTNSSNLSCQLPATTPSGSSGQPFPTTQTVHSSDSSIKQSTNQPNDTHMRTRSQKQTPTVRMDHPDKTSLSTSALPSSVAQAAHPSIPKPEGENGRPGRGGYALKAVLGWDLKEYKKAQEFIKKLVETTLPKNVHTPFTSQPETVLNPLREKMAEQFPQLRQYEDNWATDDFIRAALKYRQIQVKNRKLRMQAAQGRAMMEQDSD